MTATNSIKTTTQIVNLKCACGNVKGELNIVPKTYFHVQCLCCDCQNFAHYLRQQNTLLDEHGGTELFQTYPAHIKITKGEEHITCVQSYEKGLYRWHTQCCNTPIGNTMTSPKVPFIGIPVNFMHFSSEQEKNAVLGPITLKAFGKYAVGGISNMPEDAHEKLPLSFMPKVLGFMLKGFLGKKYTPSPFFKDGKPITKASLMSSS